MNILLLTTLLFGMWLCDWAFGRLASVSQRELALRQPAK